MADTTYAPVAEAATVQVAASVIVTAILTPLLTTWQYRRVLREEARKAASAAPRALVEEPAASREREVDLA
jgi:2-keto-3-deoxygluconate permease